GANAQTATTETKSTANDEYTIEWITPKRPPMPPVRKDGKWVPWEEVYGPLPDLPPRPIKRYKNPKPIDPVAQWVGVKRRLAPWLTEEELRAKPATTPALEAAKRRAAMKSGFVPKVNPIELREETKKRAEKQRKAAEAYQEPSQRGSGGGDDEEDGNEPQVHLAGIHFDSAGFTRYELWITDAPTDE